MNSEQLKEDKSRWLVYDMYIYIYRYISNNDDSASNSNHDTRGN